MKAINLYILGFVMLAFGTTIKAQTVLELKKPGLDQIVIKLQFRNGSISDPAGKEGLTYLTANLVKEGGTEKLTKSKIEDIIYPMAAHYSVLTDKEVTTFTFEVHKDFLNPFYDIIKGFILTPSFTEADFERVKSNQQIYVDQVIKEASDEEYSKKALEEQLFRGTNYAHMKEGTSAGVKSITLNEVKNHYKNFFTANNLTIAIAGDYPVDFLKRLKADMATKSKGILPNLPTPGTARIPSGVEIEIISKQNALGSAIFTGTPLTITRRNDDFAALMVANSWLGEHRKSYSRLYQKIREQRSMNYGDYTYIEWYESGGQNMLPVTGVPRSSNYFSIWIRPVQMAESLKKQYDELKDIQIGHAQFALRMAVKEIDQLVKNGMTKEDFELTRQFLRSYIKLYTQTPERELGFLLDSKFYGRNNYIDDLDSLLAKVSLEDVNNAIKRYFNTNNMFITIITDDSEAQPLAASLQNNGQSIMSYSKFVKEGLPKEISVEDSEVANYKLNVKSVKIIKSEDTFKK